jgi:hypothetical protein
MPSPHFAGVRKEFAIQLRQIPLWLPEGVKNSPKSPPPSPSPVKGEGIPFLFQYVSPLPSRERNRVRGGTEGDFCRFPAQKGDVEKYGSIFHKVKVFPGGTFWTLRNREGVKDLDRWSIEVHDFLETRSRNF